jgi:hypothetical protein
MDTRHVGVVLIGPITLVAKHAGERSAGHPHAPFEVEGAGNVAMTGRPASGALGREAPGQQRLVIVDGLGSRQRDQKLAQVRVTIDAVGHASLQ